MFDNRRFTWAGFFVALITLCAACATEGAQEPSKDPLNSIQQKIEVIDNRIDEQDRKMHDTVNELKSKLEAVSVQIDVLQRTAKYTVDRQTEDDNMSSLKRASQTAPIFSAGIAVISAVIAVIAALVAYRNYRINKTNAAATHMHSVFKDYLKLRLDYHQKIVEKGDAYKNNTDVQKLNNSGETLAEQMAGILLYALEEIFFWLKARKKDKLLFKGSHSKQDEQDIQDSWRDTIASHLTQYPGEVAASVDIFAECYSVEFLEYVASVLKMPEINEIVERHKKAKERGEQRPRGFAIRSYLPPSYTLKQSGPGAQPQNKM
jgi:hypothetical protein